MSASVKVMRSFDYCHFEVCLGTDEKLTDVEVDDLRKRAMRLADKAVEQYKVAKRFEASKAGRSARLESLRREVAEIEKLVEGDRTPNQMAKVKLLKDRDWQAYIDSRYDYQDDWDDEEFDDIDR